MEENVCFHIKATLIGEYEITKYWTQIHEKVVQSVPYMALRSYTRALFEFGISWLLVSPHKMS